MNFSAHLPSSSAGQFTATSTVRPTGSRVEVVNRIPPLPIFTHLPAATALIFPCRSL